jgi:hypothetical protein
MISNRISVITEGITNPSRLLQRVFQCPDGENYHSTFYILYRYGKVVISDLHPDIGIPSGGVVMGMEIWRYRDEMIKLIG